VLALAGSIANATSAFFSLQERLAMARELERLQHEEAAAAAAKKARAAALMEEVRIT
jgi:hypothetical protein